MYKDGGPLSSAFGYIRCPICHPLFKADLSPKERYVKNAAKLVWTKK
jgi:hypothetical protein